MLARAGAVALGLAAIAAALLADTLGVGREPRFGWKQGALLALGVALVAGAGARARASRRGPTAVALALAAVAAFGVVALASSEQPLAPALLYDGASYVEVAAHLRAHGVWPPPPLKLRPPLYPALIAAAGWLTGSDGLAAVVRVQAAVWVAIGPLVALWVYLVGGRLLLACLAGAAWYTLGEALFNVALIYAETVTVLLALGAGCALTASLLGGERTAAWRWVAAALALGAAHGRPIYQLLLPLYAVLAAAGPGARPSTALRRAAPFAVAAAVGLLPFYAANLVVKGVPAFVPGAGLSLANYLGDRRLLGRFPPGHEAIEARYAARFAADPRRRVVGWWEVADDWSRAVESRIGRTPPLVVLDREMGSAAAAVLARNPGYYLTRWGETWREFSTTPGPGTGGRSSPVALLRPAWSAFWSYLGAWLPFALLAVEGAVAARRGRAALVRLVPIATYLVVALANTAIEPWPGQVRYRSQVEVFLLVALGLAAGLAADRIAAAVRPARPPAAA